jgi:hypothetical protein
MTQRKEHIWNEWDYKNRCTPVWIMMLTSASCCRHVQQDSASSFSVRQDSDISTHMYIKISSSQDDVMSSTREDVIRRRHVLLQCADSSLNHEWNKTASFVSCLDACLDAVGVRPPLTYGDGSICFFFLSLLSTTVVTHFVLTCALVSTVILGFEFHGIHGHILLPNGSGSLQTTSWLTN